MFFKNAAFYTLKKWDMSLDWLNERLGDMASKDCHKTQLETIGWSKPLGKHGSTYFHAQGQYIMLRMRKHKRVVDIAAVNELVDKKIEAIEKVESRQVFKKEKAAIKETVLMDVLPDALTKSEYTNLFIDTKSKMICVDASNSRTADIILCLLRETIGSLPCVSVQVKGVPKHDTTTWLRTNSPPEGIVLGKSAQLKTIGDTGEVLTFKNCDDLVIATERHTETHLVSLIELEWEKAVWFKFKTQEFLLNGLSFTEKEIQDDGDLETYAEQYDSDMAIMCGILSNLYEDLIAIFGGKPDDLFS